MKPESKLRIVVADYQHLFRCGVRVTLESQPEWTVFEATTGKDAIGKCKFVRPQVAVLAMYLPFLNGVEAARRITGSLPETNVLLVGDKESHAEISRAFHAGARGYITRSTATRDLVAAVRSLAKGRPFLTPGISEFLLRQYLKTSTNERPPLTAREMEILQLLTEGKSNKEIAAATATSPKTIETHRARIMRKLEVRSFAELVRYAIRERIIEA